MSKTGHSLDTRQRAFECAARNPNPERALETSNHISEGMFDLVSKEKAIEAASYWKDRASEAEQTILNFRARVLANAMATAYSLGETIEKAKETYCP